MDHFKRLRAGSAIARVLAFVLVLLSLGACQTKVPIVDQEKSEWQQDSEFFAAAINELELNSSWEFKGKVGLRGPDLNESANIIWAFADQSNHVRLFGPLGAGTIKMDFDKYGVQLSDNKGLLHRGNSAEKLLTEIVGWPIPMDSLSYWLFGLPSPDAVYEYRTNDEGLLAELKQMGWQIRYSNYIDFPQYSNLRARKLVASKQISSEQSITVKIISKGWQ